MLVVTFAAGMAWVEAACVYYLRVMVDRVEPYQPDPLPIRGILGEVELVREGATLLMLAMAGMLAGRTWRARLGYAAIAFGAWEGLTFAEVRRRWPDEMTAWLADPQVAPPDGESFAEVSERVTAALRRVLADRERQTVLIVSHVTPIKMLVAAALLAPPPALYRMHLDVAALCEIDWYADGPAVLRSFNDTSHLTT